MENTPKIKLKLNRKTLSELHPDALQYVRGGLTGHCSSTSGCPTPGSTNYTCGSCTSETC